MKHLFLLLVLFAACTLPPPEFGYASFTDVPPATCHRNWSGIFDASEFTDPSEQSQLVKAVQAWVEFSGHQINSAITFTPAPGAHVIHRVHLADKVVTDYEATQQKDEAAPFHVDGWHSSGTIYLVVDRIQPDQLQSLAMHEMGHAFGLAWPLCALSHDKCIHSPDPHAVMAEIFAAAPELTPSDLALCRASCLCP